MRTFDMALQFTSNRFRAFQGFVVNKNHDKLKQLIFIVCAVVLLWFNCEKRKLSFDFEKPAVPGKYTVKIQNYQHTMWVGTNDDSTAQIMKSLVDTATKRWIGRRVLPDNKLSHGFYFDPNTITIAEMTIEGMQNTIAQITKNPAFFSENGWSNGGTTIPFILKEKSHVLVEVFDILGGRLEVLADRYYQPGRHRVAFSGKDYKSGVYLVRISTEWGTDMIKMVLIE